MTIDITRSSVMGIVEGISIIIAQKNGGTPTFEELWASESEGRKLDIYYREAIGDLERRLLVWLTTSTAQFTLSTDGGEGDYVLQLTMPQYWPTKLTGLLGNKVQDFMVHSITAGWLNDFPTVTVKEDYKAMAAADLDDIRYIVEQREFSFTESSRSTDTAKPDGDETPTAEQRGIDTDKPSGDDTATAEQRGTDTDKPSGDDTATAEQRAADTDKPDTDETPTADERGTDTDKPDGDDTATAEERAADTDKPDTDETPTAEERSADTDKPDTDETPTAEQRGTDTDKPDGDETPTADERRNDAAKGENPGSIGAESRKHESYKGMDGSDTPRGYKRKGDSIVKSRSTSPARPAVEARHRDNAPVCIGRDWTDWSGDDDMCDGVLQPFGGCHQDAFGRLETRMNSLNPAFGREVNRCDGTPGGRTAGHRVYGRRVKSTPQPYAHHHQGDFTPSPNPEDRYTPNDDKRWYEQLEDMSHQRGHEEHRGPDGVYMEKYREQHEHDAMQEHDCGRAMMTDVDL